MDFNSHICMDGVWQISDASGNCATLAVGSERAVLFDTMIGLGDLKGFVKTLTDLPVIVMNSHGHMDHMGGNFQFDTVYLHPADRPLIAADLANIPAREEHTGEDLSNCRRSLSNTDNLVDLVPDSVFDLGDLHARVLHLPGHTAGSIGLLLEEKKLLLAGDACTPQMCLFLEGAQDLSVYQDTLQLLKREAFDSFVLGHFTKLFPKAMLHKFEECTQLVGVKRGHAFYYSLIPRYTGTAYILEAYNKDAEGSVCIIVKAG